jgi:hypothetical protein
MNEKIKELAEQAGMEECSLGYGMPENVLWGENQIEDFAELIIKECIDKMEQSFAGSIGTDDQKTVWGESVNSFKSWNGAIKFSREKIKQHFGVEE